MRTEAEVRAMLDRVQALKPPYDPAVVVSAQETLAWVLGDTDELPAELDP